MRSGQKIETEHSLVLFGDVNPGAELSQCNVCIDHIKQVKINKLLTLIGVGVNIKLDQSKSIGSQNFVFGPEIPAKLKLSYAN